MKRLRYIFNVFIFILCSLICYGQTYPVSYTDHNLVHTCKNLLQKYTLDELSMMISTGNFDDIYVGDYIEMEMTSEYGTEKVRWLVAGINYFKNVTLEAITRNHIVLVAENSFSNLHQMNSSNTTAGGYAASSMHTTVLPKYDTAITNAFGSNHVLSYYQSLSTSINTTAPSMAGNNFTGCSNGYKWVTGASDSLHVTKLNLMNEPQLYGMTCMSSSFYDIGINNSQFPLFAQIPEKKICGIGFNSSLNVRYDFWLSSVVSTTNFAYQAVNGRITSVGASANCGVRPFFLFI